MEIYVAHSRSQDYKSKLYDVIRESNLNKEHTFVLQTKRQRSFWRPKNAFHAFF